MGRHRPDDLGSNDLDGAARVRMRRYLLHVAVPPLAIGFAAMAASPLMARGTLPSSERAALNLAIALSLTHLAAQNVPSASARGDSAPVAVKEPPAVAVKDAVQAGAADATPVAQAQSGGKDSPAGDSGTGATEPGGPNGPDDRNLGSGGPVGGTEPAPAGAVQDNNQGSGGATGSSGAYSPGGASDSGDQSKPEKSAPPSSAPQQ